MLLCKKRNLISLKMYNIIKLLFQESKKLKKAFEDPKFCEMFSDYLKEIADPKNRAV